MCIVISSNTVLSWMNDMVIAIFKILQFEKFLGKENTADNR